MIALLLGFILGIVSRIFNYFVLPLNLVIKNAIPVVEDLSSTIGTFWNYFVSYAKFGLSFSGLYPAVITTLIILFVPTIIIPILSHTVKLVVHWWDSIIA